MEVNVSFLLFVLRPSKPAARLLVKKNDDYHPSVNRVHSAPSKRLERVAEKVGRKPSGGPSKPSRDPRQGDRGRGQQKVDKEKGAAKKEQKVRGA